MKAAWTTVLALLCFGCAELGDDPDASGAKDVVETDWDGSVDFTAFATYEFVTDPDGGSTVPLPITRTRSAMRQEFDALGYEEVEGGDLEVIILTQTETSSELELDCAPGFYWYGYTGGYNSCLYLNVGRTEVTVGTILVGMGDASRQEVVFQGLMQGVADGRDIEARIGRAVQRMFDDYPADQTGG